MYHEFPILEFESSSNFFPVIVLVTMEEHLPVCLWDLVSKAYDYFYVQDSHPQLNRPQTDKSTQTTHYPRRRSQENSGVMGAC